MEEFEQQDEDVKLRNTGRCLSSKSPYQVSLAKQSIIHQDGDIARRLGTTLDVSQMPWSKMLYFPVIVTTANVCVCDFDAKEVDPGTWRNRSEQGCDHTLRIDCLRICSPPSSPVPSWRFDSLIQRGGDRSLYSASYFGCTEPCVSAFSSNVLRATRVADRDFKTSIGKRVESRPTERCRGLAVKRHVALLATCRRASELGR